VRNLRHTARTSGNEQVYEELTALIEPYDDSTNADTE